MTVTNTTRSVSYPGNDSDDSFAYGFRVLSSSQLVVTLRDASNNDTVQVEGVDYTVTGVGAAEGGTVEMVTPPATGETLLIQRVVSLVQGTSFRAQGSFQPSSIEDAFDYLTMAVQQIAELAFGSTQVYTGLPPAGSATEGQIIRVRPGSGQPTTYYACAETSVDGVNRWDPFLVVP